MQFARDQLALHELALLSRTGHVPRTSRAGPQTRVPRDRPRRLPRPLRMTRRQIARARALRAKVRTTWPVFGDGTQER